MKRTAERAHGTRAKYVWDGCRCFQCKLANADYQQARLLLVQEANPWTVRYAAGVRHYVVRNRETGEIVLRTPERTEAFAHRDELNKQTAAKADLEPLWASPYLQRKAVRHIRSLQDGGMGINRMATLAGLSRNGLLEIANNRRVRKDRPKKVKIRLETAHRILAIELAPASGARVDAGPTWTLLDEMIDSGVAKSHIALALGRKTPALQIQRREVRKSTADEVASLYERWKFGQWPTPAPPPPPPPQLAPPSEIVPVPDNTLPSPEEAYRYHLAAGRAITVTFEAELMADYGLTRTQLLRIRETVLADQYAATAAAKAGARYSAVRISPAAA